MEDFLKITPRVLVYFSPTSYNISPLHDQSTTIKIGKLTLVQYY
jgi:hypothetical protein